AEEELLID
ncbi:hypothetical protein ACN38_g9598, partial [Penicillium nordicum]